MMGKLYRPKMKWNWWLTNSAYFRFMVREFTSIFIAAYCGLLLCFLARLRGGPEPYERFVAGLNSPWSVLFHTIVLLAAIYHAVTWFNLTPKVMVIRIGEEKVPAAAIAGVHYAAWIGISILLIFWVGRA